MHQDASIYVSRGLKLLQKGLLSFVKKRMKSRFGNLWENKVKERLKGTRYRIWDSYGLLKIMKFFWEEAFGDLGHHSHADVSNALSVRDKWAHQEDFTNEEANRALTIMHHLLFVVGNDEIAVRKFAEEISELHKEMNTGSQLQDRKTAPPISIPPTTERPQMTAYMMELVRGVEKNSVYRHHLFDSELRDILYEAKEQGQQTIRIISKDLCFRVVDEYVDGVMVMSSNAMWAVWEWQGSRPERVIYRAPKGFSNLLEIEFDTDNLPPKNGRV